MFNKSKKNLDEKKPKILDIDADMQGKLVFKDAVELKISGNFEGNLDTKGNLIIGENAVVNAEIKGENIFVSGKVVGDIRATSKLSVLKNARIIGDINTPVLMVEEGACFQGNCHMITELGDKTGLKKQFLDCQQLAEYLEVELETVNEWIKDRKIPVFKENNEWKFDKSKIDAWVTTEKIK